MLMHARRLAQVTEASVMWGTARALAPVHVPMPSHCLTSARTRVPHLAAEEATTTRLNKNPNLNKLQAGYLFPEVSPAHRHRRCRCPPFPRTCPDRNARFERKSIPPMQQLRQQMRRRDLLGGSATDRCMRDNSGTPTCSRPHGAAISSRAPCSVVRVALGGTGGVPVCLIRSREVRSGR